MDELTLSWMNGEVNTVVNLVISKWFWEIIESVLVIVAYLALSGKMHLVILM